MSRTFRPTPLILLLILALVMTAAGPVAAAAPEGADDILVRIWLDEPQTNLAQLATAPLIPLAHEPLPTPYVLARSNEEGLAWLQENGLRIDLLDENAQVAVYCLAEAAGPLTDDLAAGQMIYEDEHRRLIRLAEGQTAAGCGDLAWPLSQPIDLLPRSTPPIPTDITPLPIIQDMIDQVDLARMMTYTEYLSGERELTIGDSPYTIPTRYTYSGEPLQMAVQYMASRLAALGLDVTLHQWHSTYPPNIIAEKPGLTQPDDIYIIGGHLDSTSSSAMTSAPGADDNASGSVGVLMAAEIMAPYNFDSTLRFALFTGEEQGLLGSAAYANLVSDQNILGMLNMDMIAWDGSGGPDMDIHARSTVPGSMEMGYLFADVVDAYGLNLAPVVYSNGTGASDHASFWNRGFAAILAIENYRSDAIPSDFNPYYHSTNDRTIHFNQPYFDNMVKASLATFAHLAPPITTCYWADLNCDCLVDVFDIGAAADHWGAYQGQWNYHFVYDINSDSMVSVLDLQEIAAEWQWSCTP